MIFQVMRVKIFQCMTYMCQLIKILYNIYKLVKNINKPWKNASKNFLMQ